MSPLYIFNKKILVRDGKLAASQKCCCGSSSSSSSSSGGGCVDCYKLDFEWVFLNNCCAPKDNLVGTLLMNSNGIACYDCPEITSSSTTDLSFSNLCGEGTYSYLSIYCDTSTLVYGTIDSTPSSYVYAILPVNLCCLNSGSYQITADDGNSILYINMSPANSGSCDCSGYTTVFNP